MGHLLYAFVINATWAPTHAHTTHPARFIRPMPPHTSTSHPMHTVASHACCAPFCPLYLTHMPHVSPHHHPQAKGKASMHLVGQLPPADGNAWYSDKLRQHHTRFIRLMPPFVPLHPPAGKGQSTPVLDRAVTHRPRSLGWCPHALVALLTGLFDGCRLLFPLSRSPAQAFPCGQMSESADFAA